MKRSSARALAAVMAFSTGCPMAGTRVTAVVDPDYRGRAFHRVVVSARVGDLAKRRIAEDSFVSGLRQSGIEAIPATEVMLPTRAYTAEEIRSIVARAGADGLLVMSLTGAYHTAVYLPGSSTTTGTAHADGSAVSWTATTTEYPGTRLDRPSVEFETRLVDPATGSTAWMSTSVTQGAANAEWETLMESLARETLTKLAADGAIPGPPRPAPAPRPDEVVGPGGRR